MPVALGAMYSESGEGLHDKVEAYAWFSVAETYPDLDEFRRQVIEIGKRSSLEGLTPAEVESAQRKASEYISLYGK